MADLRSTHLSATCGKPLKVYTYTPTPPPAMRKHKCMLDKYAKWRETVYCTRTHSVHTHARWSFPNTARIYRGLWNRVKISTEDQTRFSRTTFFDHYILIGLLIGIHVCHVFLYIYIYMLIIFSLFLIVNFLPPWREDRGFLCVVLNFLTRNYLKFSLPFGFCN